MEFEELQEKILDWAYDKDLLHEENVDKQFLKFIEEVFEFKTEMDNVFSDAYIHVDDAAERMELEMGDIFVTLIVLCEQLQIDLINCLEWAYKKIKNREEKTIVEQFIKED